MHCPCKIQGKNIQGWRQPSGQCRPSYPWPQWLVPSTPEPASRTLLSPEGPARPPAHALSHCKSAVFSACDQRGQQPVQGNQLPVSEIQLERKIRSPGKERGHSWRGRDQGGIWQQETAKPWPTLFPGHSWLAPCEGPPEAMPVREAMGLRLLLIMVHY